MLRKERRLIWDRLVFVHHLVAGVFVGNLGDLVRRATLNASDPCIDDGCLLAAVTEVVGQTNHYREG